MASHIPHNNNTWHGRLKAIIGHKGYHIGMRRSLQTIVLYEARRAIEPRLKTLRPYQRKAAFMEQCFFLLDSLDFIFANQKVEILWRTMTSRVQLDGDTAWSRLKGINRELANLAEKVKPFLMEGRSHNESVDMLVQDLFESKDESNKGKTCPWTWEHAHNHVIMAFRLYYKGDKLDPHFPTAPICPDMTIPRERPVKKEMTFAPQSHKTDTSVRGVPSHDEADEPALDVAAILGEPTGHGGGVAATVKTPGDDRRQALKEVREHLDLLKEFEGVIPEEEIAKRKRELFLSLPPAPAPANKKLKTVV